MSLVRDYSKYSITPGGLWRHQNARDAVNAKDWMLGDGLNTPPPLIKYIKEVNSTYVGGGAGAAAVGVNARAAHVPGGTFDGDTLATALEAGVRYTIATVGTTDWTLVGAPNNMAGTEFVATGPGVGNGTAHYTWETTAHGYSVFGHGRVSQLRNLTFRTLNTNVRMGNVAITGTGVPAVGTGLDLRSGLFFGYGVDINNKDILVDNSMSATAGGFGSNNTMIGGWLRGGRIGVNSAGNDLRLCFVRVSDTTEVGVLRKDAGGIHLIGMNVATITGPSIRWEGKSYSFTGDLVTGSVLVTGVTDFSNIVVGDVVGSLALGGNTLPNTRITAFDAGVGTVTLNLPAQNTVNDAVIIVNQIPIEDFYADNTLNSGRTDDLEFNITNIATADAGAAILVTLSNPLYKVSFGDSSVLVKFTGVSSYDDNTTPSAQQIISIPDWYTVKLNIPFAGNQVTPGKFIVNNYDAEIITHTNAAHVREQFFIGNNINRTFFRGGANFNFIGTRLKSTIYFDGIRPFRGNTTLGSDQITDINIPTSEIRVGLPLFFSPANFPNYTTTVVQIVNATTIRVSALSTATTTTVNGFPGVLIRSTYTPSNIFQVPLVDAGGAALEDIAVTYPSGPGATLAWGQVGFFPNAINAYVAAEGSYFVGARCPYTAGGLLDMRPAHLNEMGVMNTGFHVRSNSVRHILQGDLWKSSTNAFTVTGNNVNVAGIPGNSTGADVSFNVRAHRSGTSFTPGDVYGNSISRWEAPLAASDGAGTAVIGYCVAPGDSSADAFSSFFLGVNGDAVTAPILTGDKTSLRALASIFEFRSDNRITGWHTSAEWLSLAGGTIPNYISVNENATKVFTVANSGAGAASSAISASQTATPSSPASVQNIGVTMQAYGIGWAPVGTHDLADGAAVYSGAGLSAGLTLAALAGDLRLRAAGNVAFGTLTASADAPVSGYITIKDAAGTLRKLAVIN